jgi:polyhydroxyalkanoate synthesis regulator phasin
MRNDPGGKAMREERHEERRGEGEATEETGSTREGRASAGWSRGLGILSAFKDAMEETINEARERGDLSSERAREILSRAADRAREATSDARERFDFVSRTEYEELAGRVAALEARLRDRLGGDVSPGSPSDGEGGGGSGGPS